LTALAAAALVAIPRGRWQTGMAALLVVLIPGAWLIAGSSNPPAIWKESEVNSTARRAWTRQAADYLAMHYHPGDGLIYSFGDLTGVLREAGIPLREGLHQGNHPAWDAATLRPDLFFREEWALAVSGDPIATAILRTQRRGPHYDLKKQIIVEGAPVIEIYQRQRPENR